jgi:hypothetical protein
LISPLMMKSWAIYRLREWNQSSLIYADLS